MTNPDPELFFEGNLFLSVFERTSAPHDQRRAVASAYRIVNAGDFFVLRGISRNFDDRAAKYL